MRCAIYYCPAPGTALHDAGSAWLGRDLFSHHETKQPPSLADVTAEPRRYGLHATLKPPFALQGAEARAELRGAVARLAASLLPVSTGPIELRLLDGFLAIVARTQPVALSALADICVKELDFLRKPPSEEEMARRRAAGLTKRQEDHLALWGYPYVFEDFRFHITLTRRLSSGEADVLMAKAKDHFAQALQAPLVIDALSLLSEASPGAPFQLEEQIPLRSPLRETA